MDKFKIVASLSNGTVVESPPIELCEGESTYEVARDLIERNTSGRFFHIDGGDSFQKIIPLEKLQLIEVLAIEEEVNASTNERTGRQILSLVE